MGRASPGHDLGHAAEPSWRALVESHVEACGNWVALATLLASRLAGVDGAPRDPQTIEKGLRRLASRAPDDGGQYGRWVLRYLGVAPSWSRYAAWLGQYHSRFADLPTGVRLAQLAHWDRPMITGTSVEAWIQVGMASVLHRRLDLEACDDRLARARACAPRATPAARAELALLSARIATDAGRRDDAERAFAEVDALLDEIGPTEGAVYFARVQGQRAYHARHPLEGAPDHARALALFESIPASTGVPFVDFRRAEGCAASRFGLGERALGIALAREALEHAADGGFVRMRVLALKLLARMLGDAEGEAALSRARRLALLLEDEDLIQRAH